MSTAVSKDWVKKETFLLNTFYTSLVNYLECRI